VSPRPRRAGLAPRSPVDGDTATVPESARIDLPSGWEKPMRVTDAAHLGLMLTALGLAYLVPFELLLLAYVVLGPAHYATEISWLHDRKYFLPQRGVAIALALIAIVAALIENASWFGFVMWSAFLLCALIAATTTPMQAVLFVIAAMGVTAALAMHGASLAVVGVLLPTLIHVSLFTLVFMTLGAWRSGARVQWVLVAVYVAAIGLILMVPPSAATLIPSKPISRTSRRRSAGCSAFPICGWTRGSPACSPSSTPITISTGSSKPRSFTGIR
jgi:hypothetical protein